MIFFTPPDVSSSCKNLSDNRTCSSLGACYHDGCEGSYLFLGDRPPVEMVSMTSNWSAGEMSGSSSEGGGTLTGDGLRPIHLPFISNVGMMSPPKWGEQCG